MLCLSPNATRTAPDTAEWPVLWQVIASLRNGRLDEAELALQQNLETTQTQQQAIAHYALGHLAARKEAWADARHHWQAAYDNGLQPPHLQSNLAELYYHLAEDNLMANQTAEASLAAQQAAKLYEERPSAFDELEAQIHQRQGFQAAQDGQWQTALTHWIQARKLDGSSYRLAYNFALTLERLEQFANAGEAWREALRRRPRRSDHPDAVSDEQISRLWQRSAEAYQKAGEFDEAVQVYRHAVKWNEHDLTVRLALSTSLMNNGQIRAAENELQRILQIEPNHVPALIQLGESFAASDQWHTNMRAVLPWKQALALEPQNQQVRQLLADFYVNQAEIAYSWDSFDRAISQYELALEYQPKKTPILAALGSCYLMKNERQTAQQFIDQALELATEDLGVYDPIIKAWLALGEMEEVERLVVQMETAVPHIPFQFFMNLVVFCLETGQPTTLHSWLEKAVALAPPSENLLLAIGEMLMMIGDPVITRDYLERAIKAKQEPASAYLALGMLAIRTGDPDLAENHWNKAEKLARSKKDFALLDTINETRQMFGSPFGALFGGLKGGAGLPNLLDLLNSVEDFEEIWDDGEEWDDDEEWDDYE